MAGLPWKRRGTFKRRRAIARADAGVVSVAVDERHDNDESYGGEYDCDCDLCIPDAHERVTRLREIQRNRPVFTVADRLLAQVGLVLRQL